MTDADAGAGEEGDARDDAPDVGLDEDDDSAIDMSFVGDFCEIPDDDGLTAAIEATMEDSVRTQNFNRLLAAIPLLVPVLSFVSWDLIASCVRHTIDFLANRNWESVDGNACVRALLSPRHRAAASSATRAATRLGPHPPRERGFLGRGGGDSLSLSLSRTRGAASALFRRDAPAAAPAVGAVARR